MAVKRERVSDDAVKAKTGKNWAQWFAVLDKDGAKKLAHREIAQLLSNKHGVPSWWCQMVTVEYEKERGLRVTHQRPDGYSISRSKTIGAPVEALFDAWNDPRRRKRWLAEVIDIRKATPHKSVRFTWPDKKTNVEVLFLPKGAGKTQVSVQHNKLAGLKAAARMKKYWGEKLDGLAATLEG